MHSILVITMFYKAPNAELAIAESTFQGEIRMYLIEIAILNPANISSWKILFSLIYKGEVKSDLPGTLSEIGTIAEIPTPCNWPQNPSFFNTVPTPSSGHLCSRAAIRRQSISCSASAGSVSLVTNEFLAICS